MKFQQAVNKSMGRIAVATVRRREWADLGWVLTVSALQGDMYWSHRSPYSPWIPKWDDLAASDWEPVETPKEQAR